jgi:hypothetical protein
VQEFFSCLVESQFGLTGDSQPAVAKDSLSFSAVKHSSSAQVHTDTSLRDKLVPEQ